MKTIQEAKDMAQSFIDDYIYKTADEWVKEMLEDLAVSNGQILDNIVKTRWFHSVVFDFITSHEGVKK